MEGKEGEGKDSKSSFFKRKSSRKAQTPPIESEGNTVPDESHRSRAVKSSTLPSNHKDRGAYSMSWSPSEGLFSKLKRKFRMRSRGKYDFKDMMEPRRMRRKSDEPNTLKDSDVDEDIRDAKITSSVKTSRRTHSDKEDVILIRKNKRVSVLCKTGDKDPEVIFSNVMNSEDDETESFGEGGLEDPYATINSVKDEIQEKFSNHEENKKSEKLERDRVKARELLAQSVKTSPSANGGLVSPTVENVEDLYAKIKPKNKESKPINSDPVVSSTDENTLDVSEFNRLAEARLKSRFEPQYETLEDVRQRSSKMYPDGLDDDGYEDLSHDSSLFEVSIDLMQEDDPDYETLEDVKNKVEQSFSSSSSSKGESSSSKTHKHSLSHYSKLLDNKSSKLSGSAKSTSLSSFSTSDRSPIETAGGSKDSKSEVPPKDTSPVTQKKSCDTAVNSSGKDSSRKTTKGPAPLATSVDSSLPTEESESSSDSPLAECIYDNPNVILRKQLNRQSLGSLSPSNSRRYNSQNLKTPAEEELVEKLSSLLAPPLPLRNYLKDEVSKGAGAARHSWAPQSSKSWDMSESWHGSDSGWSGNSLGKQTAEPTYKASAKSKSQELFERVKGDMQSSSYGASPNVPETDCSKDGVPRLFRQGEAKMSRPLSPHFKILATARKADPVSLTYPGTLRLSSNKSAKNAVDVDVKGPSESDDSLSNAQGKTEKDDVSNSEEEQEIIASLSLDSESPGVDDELTSLAQRVGDSFSQYGTSLSTSGVSTKKSCPSHEKTSSFISSATVPEHSLDHVNRTARKEQEHAPLAEGEGSSIDINSEEETVINGDISCEPKTSTLSSKCPQELPESLTSFPKTINTQSTGLESNHIQRTALGHPKTAEVSVLENHKDTQNDDQMTKRASEASASKVNTSQANGGNDISMITTSRTLVSPWIDPDFQIKRPVLNKLKRGQNGHSSTETEDNRNRSLLSQMLDDPPWNTSSVGTSQTETNGNRSAHAQVLDEHPSIARSYSTDGSENNGNRSLLAQMLSEPPDVSHRARSDYLCDNEVEITNTASSLYPDHLTPSERELIDLLDEDIDRISPPLVDLTTPPVRRRRIPPHLMPEPMERIDFAREYGENSSGGSDHSSDLGEYNENAPRLYHSSSSEEEIYRKDPLLNIFLIKDKICFYKKVTPHQSYEMAFDADSVHDIKNWKNREKCRKDLLLQDDGIKTRDTYAYNSYEATDFVFPKPLTSVNYQVLDILLATPILLENLINGHFCPFIAINPYYMVRGSFQWSRIFTLPSESLEKVEEKLYCLYHQTRARITGNRPDVMKKLASFRPNRDYWSVVDCMKTIQDQPTFRNIRLHLLGTEELIKYEPDFRICTKFPRVVDNKVKLNDLRVNEVEFRTSREAPSMIEKQDDIEHDDDNDGRDNVPNLLVDLSKKTPNLGSSAIAKRAADEPMASNPAHLPPGLNSYAITLLSDFMGLCNGPKSTLPAAYEDDSDSDEDDENESMTTYINITAVSPSEARHNSYQKQATFLSFSRSLRGELAYTARMRKPGSGDKSKLSSWTCSGMDSHLSFTAWEEMDRLMKKLVPHISPRLDFQFLLRLYSEFKFFVLRERQRNKQRRGCFFMDFYGSKQCCKKEEFIFLKMIRDELRYFSNPIQSCKATESLFLEEHSVAYALTRLLSMILETLWNMKQSMLPQDSEDEANVGAVQRYSYKDRPQPFSEQILRRENVSERTRFHVVNYKAFRTSSMWYDLQTWQPPSDFLEDPNLLRGQNSVFTHADNAIHVAQFGGYADLKPLHEREGFTESMEQLRTKEWYWGPLSYEQATLVLKDHRDGTFLVRDSSDKKYLLSLSFISLGEVHHTRIEHAKGLFSFWSQPESHTKGSICEFIDISVQNSKDGRFLYFLRPSSRGTPPIPIRLLYPLSRNFRVPSLRHLSRFSVRQSVRIDHIRTLPVPQKVKAYLTEKQYFVEVLLDDNWALEREGSVPK